MAQERLREEEKLEELKQKQAELDEEFSQKLAEKEESLIKQQQNINTLDQDKDGLTYSEELKLNTDPFNLDSDGDGIQDGEDAHPAGGGINHKITVHWQHNGRDYTTQFGIPEDRYLYYKNRPRSYCCESWEKFATPNDITIKNIAKDITDVSISTGDTCKICIAIDFVESMIYEYDIDYIGQNEYPKYAIETIIDEKGDCEDTSFLMASILEALGIDTILFVLPEHLAVGVYCNGCSGTYYTYKGRKYYFLETTGAPGSWEIGRASYDLNELENIIEV